MPIVSGAILAFLEKPVNESAVALNPLSETAASCPSE
jgi:hypothetical protein